MSYFDELFGTPEIKSEQWANGHEPGLNHTTVIDTEPLSEFERARILRLAWNKDTTDPHSAAYGLPSDANTIDTDFEIVK